MEKKMYGRRDQRILNINIEDFFQCEIDENNLEDIEFPIEVLEYRPMAVVLTGEYLLEDILTRLDEEYADPDGDYTVASHNLKEAANKFVDIIKKEYHVWGHEPTGKVFTYTKEEYLKRVV